MSLIAKKTGRVVWTHKLDYGTAVWAKDGRAVALETVSGYFLWRDGAEPYTVRIPKVPGSGGTDNYDYALQCAWSPDKRRFAATFGLSGMADIGPHGSGRLYCYKLGHHGHYQAWVCPSNYFAGKIAWQDNQTVLFWRVKETAPELYPRPRRWHVP